MLEPQMFMNIGANVYLNNLVFSIFGFQDIILLPLMCFTFYKTKKLINTFYEVNFKNNKLGMLQFFIFETVF